jgi:CHAT domain-containing protein
VLGADVAEGPLRARKLDRYRVIYFATHGLLPGELRCQSEPGLALTPPATAATRTDEDGLLDASEIATLRIDADLVVLSACNTGGGDGKFGGAALSGLAEAFFHAGARSMLVSHWQVPSVPTVGLMTGMFERLGATTSGASAEALRQSQLALAQRSETAHPFFWAAFTLVGDGAAARPNTAAAREIEGGG